MCDVRKIRGRCVLWHAFRAAHMCCAVWDVARFRVWLRLMALRTTGDEKVSAILGLMLGWSQHS